MAIEVQEQNGIGIWVRIAVAQPEGNLSYSEIEENAIWLTLSEARALAGKIVSEAAAAEFQQKELERIQKEIEADEEAP